MNETNETNETGQTNETGGTGGTSETNESGGTETGGTGETGETSGTGGTNTAPRFEEPWDLDKMRQENVTLPKILAAIERIRELSWKETYGYLPSDQLDPNILLQYKGLHEKLAEINRLFAAYADNSSDQPNQNRRTLLGAPVAGENGTVTGGDGTGEDSILGKITALQSMIQSLTGAGIADGAAEGDTLEARIGAAAALLQDPDQEPGQGQQDSIPGSTAFGQIGTALDTLANGSNDLPNIQTIQNGLNSLRLKSQASENEGGSDDGNDEPEAPSADVAAIINRLESAFSSGMRKPASVQEGEAPTWTGTHAALRGAGERAGVLTDSQPSAPSGSLTPWSDILNGTQNKPGLYQNLAASALDQNVETKNTPVTNIDLTPDPQETQESGQNPAGALTQQEKDELSDLLSGCRSAVAGLV